MNSTGDEAIDVEFADRKLADSCGDEKKAKKRWAIHHRKVLVRIALLLSAETLADLENAPGRCHALTGDRAGQFALDLWGSYRLVFRPAHDPLPTLDDGGIDRAMVTKVRVLEVTDYHGD